MKIGLRDEWYKSMIDIAWLGSIETSFTRAFHGLIKLTLQCVSVRGKSKRSLI